MLIACVSGSLVISQQGNAHDLLLRVGDTCRNLSGSAKNCRNIHFVEIVARSGVSPWGL
jgi:hypothetical protein